VYTVQGVEKATNLFFSHKWRYKRSAEHFMYANAHSFVWAELVDENGTVLATVPA